jgi:hypothetical protein
VREKNIWTGSTRAAKEGKNLFYQHDKPNAQTKEGPLSFVLFEYPFTFVSTVSRSHPSLVSLRMSMFSVRHDRMYILPECADPAAPHSPQYPENLILCFNMKANSYGILYYSTFNVKSLLIDENVQYAT